MMVSSSGITSAAATAAMTCSAGRVAVVTGANKGIGYYVAMQLALSGLFQNVLLGCRDASRAEEAVAQIRKALQEQRQQQQQQSSSDSGKDNVVAVDVTWAPLTLGDVASHAAFTETLRERYGGKIDCLVNNAAIAFKNADPTPFKQQTKPTLDVNFRGTVDLTERLLPLLRKGSDPRLINVASMAGRLKQLSAELQKKISSETLTMPELQELVNQFEQAVQEGTHLEKGWSSSNYAISKLAIIAATKIWAREEAGVIAVNACCPGYCKTDMTSQLGLRDPAEGAKNAVIPATMKHPPMGEFFMDYKVGVW